MNNLALINPKKKIRSFYIKKFKIIKKQKKNNYIFK